MAVNTSEILWEAGNLFVSLVWCQGNNALLEAPKVKNRCIQGVPPGGSVQLYLPLPPGRPAQADGVGLCVLLNGERWIGPLVVAPLDGWPAVS